MDVRPLAVLLPTLEIGGAERSASLLAGALAARGERVDLVVGRVVGSEGRALVPAGVRLVELGTRRVLTSFGALRRYLVRERPEALLTNLTHANAMAVITRALGAPPVRLVVVEHSTLSGFARHSGVARHRLLPLAARLTYPRADAVVTVSDAARRDLARITRLEEHRIALIGNGIPVAGLLRSAAEPAPHPWLEDRSVPVLLAIGNLRPVKDFPAVLRAFRALRERRPGRLVVLGEGRERRRLEHLVGRLGLERDVLLAGLVANPYAWIARAAGVVHASLSEGLPTVLLEAAALGRPVVAVDRPGGAREVVAHGPRGLLVPPGDAAALAEGMAWAIDTPAGPVSDRLLHEHDPDSVAERYLGLLRPAGAPPVRAIAA